MSSDADRVAQVFIWKQGSAPDLDYARHVVAFVNADTALALEREDPPVRLYAVRGRWPDEPWELAIVDMKAAPTPDGSEWTDTSRYDLAGWQGADTATGERLFTVTAYRRAAPPAMFTGSSVSAPPRPPSPVANVPYYPQFPAGLLSWPPGESDDHSPGTRPDELFAYSPFNTNPLAHIDHPSAEGGPPRSPGEPGGPPGPTSYAPYYAGIGTRLSAALIDMFFVALFETGALAGLVWKTTSLDTSDLRVWWEEVWVFIILGLVLAFLYHAVQLGIWGQTIGKRLLSIKVVSAQGNLPSFGQVLLRMLGYLFSLAVAGWGFIMIALDPRRQGLHDRIAATFVIPEKPPSTVPVGLPGYAHTTHGTRTERPVHPTGDAPHLSAAVGMAAVGSPVSHSVGDLSAGHSENEVGAAGPGSPEAESESTPVEWSQAATEVMQTRQLTEREMAFDMTSMRNILRGPVTDMNIELAREQTDVLSRSERARALFKQGIEEMERGTLDSASGLAVEADAARSAAEVFREALALVPNSVAYRYYFAVALRHSSGFETALHEFQQVLELDPSHYEARQQIVFGARWHDAFAYPAWLSPAPIEIDRRLPAAMASLLPSGPQPVTRLVLLREGGIKMAAFLSRTPRVEWSPDARDALAKLHLRLSRTPSGPIVALYIVLHDRPRDPYVGETFLNPHEPDHPISDASRLGQHMLEQLRRQNQTFLIFVDEDNRLLLSRKLLFDAPTQVSMNRILYEAQTLPPQALDADRFRDAAEWHMAHFSLEEIKSEGT